MTDPIRPFSNGTEYAIWDAANCQRCTKASYLLPENSWPTCEIEAALTEAYLGDGTITPTMAQRMGHDGNGRCREFTARA